MNKKFNTLLFVLGATVFNIAVTVITFILLITLYSFTLAQVLPDAAFEWLFLVFFIGSIVVSFFLYRRILNKILARINFEDYFDPIIKPRKPPQKKS